MTFKDGRTTLGTGTLSTVDGVTTATFTTSRLTVGSHTITASYAGSKNLDESISEEFEQIVQDALSQAAVALTRAGGKRGVAAPGWLEELIHSIGG